MATDNARTATAPRVPDHDRLGHLVARSLGLDAASLCKALRPATMDDLPDLVNFRREHLLKGTEWDDDAYLRWRYRLGRTEGGFGDMWLLRLRDRLVAAIGVENLHAELDGVPLIGAQVMDLVVHPMAQQSGLGIWLNQAMIARHDFTLAVGANQNSAGIVRRLFEALPARLTFTHPLDLGPFVRRRWPVLAAALLSIRAVNAGLALRRLMLRRHRPRDLVIDCATQLDGEAELPGHTGTGTGAVQLRRKGVFLQQRLLGNPRRSVMLRVARRSGVLAGLIAWSIQADDHGRPELHIVDWYHDRDETLLGLLLDAVDEAGARRCSCVRLVLHDEVSQRIAIRAGFLPSSEDGGRLCGVQSREPALAARLARARWALTPLSDDGDGF